MNTDSEKRIDLAILVALTLAAAWLRLLHLGQPSLWWDEFITLGTALPPLPDLLTTLMHQGPSDVQEEFFPPLTHLIAHGLTRISHSDALLRLPGVLASTLSVPLFYLLCRAPLGRGSALLAALLATFSVYHMHYGRELRPYALFMFENIAALCAVYRASVQRRRGMYWLYGLCALLMLSTSYMGATLLAAQTLFAAGVLAMRFRQGERASSTRDFLTLAAALACAGALYLPWFPAQLNAFKVLHDPGFTPRITLDFLSTAFKEFAAYAYAGEYPAGWVLLGLGLAGWIAALSAARSRPLAVLLALWALLPVAAIFAAKARMELSSRYIFPLFFFLLVFAAHAVSAAVQALANALPGGDKPIAVARLSVTLALGVLLTRPDVTSLRDYYSRETSYNKQLVASIAETIRNQSLVLYYDPRNLKLVFDWYGDAMLGDARILAGAEYRRAVLLAPSSMHAAEKLKGSVWRRTINQVDVLSVGLARTPVIPLAGDAQGRFALREDFSGLGMLENVHSAENMAPSLVRKTLTVHDPGQPAKADFRFEALPGQTAKRVRVRAEFSTRLTAEMPTDAVVRLIAALPDGARTLLARVDMASFRSPDGQLVQANHEHKRRYFYDADVPALAGASGFDLIIEMDPALRSATIDMEQLDVQADMGGPAAAPGDAVRALVEQLPVARWRPDRALVLSEALYAFSPDGALEAQAVGTPDELAAYKAAHPGQSPVRVLRAADGAPAVELYDPALADPFLHLAPEALAAVTAWPADQREVRGIELRGTLTNPVLDLGGAPVGLPVASPSPAVLRVNPGSVAQLTLSPLFTEGADITAGATESVNIRRNDGEDCLACQDDGPCSITYAFRSGLPVMSLYLTAYPRVYSDAARRNGVRTLVSTDGGPWREAARYGSSGSGLWEGLKVPQFTLLKLEAPARDVRVRFELTGSKAQLWSSQDAPLSVQATMDASRVPLHSIDFWPVAVRVSNPQPVELFLSQTPNVFADRLKRTR